MEEKKTFIEHLEELRYRLLSSFIVLIIFSVFGYIIHDQLIRLLIKPLGTSLIYSSPAGALNFILRISLIFGLFCSTPIILYHIIKFISPAFTQGSIKKTSLIIFISILLLAAGATFAYLIALPSSLYFLSKFGSNSLNPLISTEEYLNFISVYLLGFGMIFQLPLILFCINYFHKLEIKYLIKHSRYFILFSFILAAVLTPTPDVINQFIMAVPIIFLYFISIIIIWVFNKKKGGKRNRLTQ